MLFLIISMFYLQRRLMQCLYYTISILLFQFLVALQAQGVRSMVHGPGVYSKDFYFLSCRQEKTC